MRPSRLLLSLLLASVLFALVAVAAPFIPVAWVLVPFALVVALFIVDWLISPGLRGVEVKLSAEREVFVGEDVAFAFELSKPPKLKELSGVISQSDGLTSPAEFHFDAGRATIGLFARRRGIWTIERLWLRWSSKLKMIDFIALRKLDCTIHVVPNIRMITSGQIDLEMRSATFGAKQTQWRGEGSEFHQLNDFVQGMDPRSIDWKRSARQNSLVAKEMRAERNHQIIMALDNGHLMREEIAGLPKIDHKINAALALAWAGIQGGDQVGYFAFDARPRHYSPPRSGRAAFSHMRSEMAQLEYKSVETNHTLGLSNLHSRLSKRSLIVVFSDFVDPLTAQLLVDHVAVLNKHHVIIFVSLRDPLLDKIISEQPKTMDEIARSVTAANLLAERRTVLDKMAAMGVYVIETNPGNMTSSLINTYLAIKAKEEI
ncbi:MAG: DUF58 domain-containing protein [Rhizobiaceae bacterium]